MNEKGPEKTLKQKTKYKTSKMRIKLRVITTRKLEPRQRTVRTLNTPFAREVGSFKPR